MQQGVAMSEIDKLVSSMNRCFCADVRQMLDEGKDPVVELAIEQTRRATQ